MRHRYITASSRVDFARPRSAGRQNAAIQRLELIDALAGEPTLRSYHYLPSVRGDLLMKVGRFDEARAEFERAAELTQNAQERALLSARASDTSYRSS